MDGAVIFDHQGRVLAAGAIVQVPAGSIGGGGSLAAAKRLRSMGMGIRYPKMELYSLRIESLIRDKAGAPVGWVERSEPHRSVSRARTKIFNLNQYIFGLRNEEEIPRA